MSASLNVVSRSMGLVAALVLSLAVVQAQGAQAGKQTSRVVTIEFESKLIKAKLPYNVVLPPDYDRAEPQSRRYPVLYLLHGLTGHYPNWTTNTRLAEYAAAYQLLIVTPEGNNGWYTDSASVPSDKYESYLLEELIPDVERRFRVLDSREHRSIAGLSMGGYGALKFGIKYPEKFVFAASFSGAVDAASFTEESLRGYEWIWKTLAPVFGPVGGATRDANDLTKLIGNLPAQSISRLPFIYLDCGTEDPLLNSNRKLANLLTDKKIPHEYRQLPGAHDWKYWDRQVVEVLRIAVRRMEPAPKS